MSQGHAVEDENTMHMAAIVLSNHCGHQVGELIDLGTRRFATFFDYNKIVQKTRAGALELHRRLASCCMQEVIASTFGDLEDGRALDLIGFDSPAEHDNVPEGARSQDDHLAATLFELVLAESAQFELSAMTYSHACPGRFFLLVGESDEVALAKALASIRWDWEHLQELERIANSDSHMRKYLLQLRWPAEQWCREVFIMLSECDFKLPLIDEVSRRLYGFAHSFHTTNLSEELFGKLLYKEGAHTAGQMNMASVWHHSSTTDILKEYCRSEVLVAQAVQRDQPAPIAEALLRSKAADFSLDGGLLNGFGDGAAFPRISPATLKLRGGVPDCLARQLRPQPPHARVAARSCRVNALRYCCAHHFQPPLLLITFSRRSGASCVA